MRQRSPSGQFLAVRGELDQRAAAPITLLMIDDEPLTARTAERLLSLDPGIRFHACSDPAAAPALAAKLRPSIILQDMVMPTADGIAMVRAFRAAPETRDVPILVLSSEEEPMIKANAFAAGADDYMVKFPDRVEMVARIRHHADRYQRGRAHDDAALALATSCRKLEAETRLLRATFGRYLSEPIVNQLLAPEGLDLGGTRRKVTIMMTDLRGFTALSERMSPERMVGLINNYLDVMTEILVRHGGTIDEFIGDAILALFGAPWQGPDDAERAVACAVEMQLAMPEVNERNRAMGLPEVEMGIGLHTGEVMVGNIGSSRRAKYAVVGSAVNLTARIESYTTGGQVLISQATLDEAGASVIVDGHMDVTPKGVKGAVRIHRVGGLRAPYDLLLHSEGPEMSAPMVALRARFAVVNDKDAGDVWAEGWVTRCSRQGAEIASTVRVPALSNVILQLLSPDGRVLAEDLYGKVTGVGRGAGAFVVRFTSVAAETAALLDSAGAAGEGADAQARGPSARPWTARSSSS